MSYISSMIEHCPKRVLPTRGRYRLTFKLWSGENKDACRIFLATAVFGFGPRHLRKEKSYNSAIATQEVFVFVMT